MKTKSGRKKTGNATFGALPAELASRLLSQLGEEEMSTFAICLEEEAVPGLRFNTLKGSSDRLESLVPFALEPIPWASAGYTFPIEERPGKNLCYQAGLYYLQEPSAMAPAAALGVKPGERVLDLCAAPGGKTTQLAAALEGEGLLVANDNSAKRIRPLIWNLEHWGAVNTVVLNEDPARLVSAFLGYFDKILVDAPCSGEGMFRKDRKALQGWRRYNGQACRKVQDRLLDQAAAMLAPGGRLIYSTCTFNPLENEEAVAAFLERWPSFRLMPLPVYEGWRSGKLFNECCQLWPHLVKGEGQFLALMERTEAMQRSDGRGDGQGFVEGAETEGSAAIANRVTIEGRIGAEGFAGMEELMPFIGFMEENFVDPPVGPFAIYGDHVYRIPTGLPSLAGLHVSRFGWYLGLIRNGRFNPAQSFAMGIKSKQMRRQIDFSPEDERVERYLRGETILTAGEKGWTLVTIGGYPLGFGKQTGDYLKNEYASGWRIL